MQITRTKLTRLINVTLVNVSANVGFCLLIITNLFLTASACTNTSDVATDKFQLTWAKDHTWVAIQSAPNEAITKGNTLDSSSKCTIAIPHRSKEEGSTPDFISIINPHNWRALETAQTLSGTKKTVKNILISNAIPTSKTVLKYWFNAYPKNKANVVISPNEDELMRGRKSPRAFWPKLKSRVSKRLSFSKNLLQALPGTWLPLEPKIGGRRIETLYAAGLTSGGQAFSYAGRLFLGEGLSYKNGHFYLSPWYALANEQDWKNALQTLSQRTDIDKVVTSTCIELPFSEFRTFVSTF